MSRWRICEFGLWEPLGFSMPPRFLQKPKLFGWGRHQHPDFLHFRASRFNNFEQMFAKTLRTYTIGLGYRQSSDLFLFMAPPKFEVPVSSISALEADRMACFHTSHPPCFCWLPNNRILVFL